MKNFRLVLTTALVALPLGVFAGGAMKGHPNIEAARNLLNSADLKIDAAQRANEYDMNGHAAKAKELVGQAKEELRQAAEVATEKKR